jgi:excinuclease UvrABC nuclease subunit
MDSRSIEGLKSTTWYPFYKDAKKDLLAIAPHLPGVYVIRWHKRFKRFLGETDIVYIGCATYGKRRSRKGLNRRIYGYLNTSERRRTSYRVMTWVGEIGNFEIAFIVCNNDNDAKELENTLLREFEEEHAELPPFNRQGNKKEI